MMQEKKENDWIEEPTDDSAGQDIDTAKLEEEQKKREEEESRK